MYNEDTSMILKPEELISCGDVVTCGRFDLHFPQFTCAECGEQQCVYEADFVVSGWWPSLAKNGSYFVCNQTKRLNSLHGKHEQVSLSLNNHAILCSLICVKTPKTFRAVSMVTRWLCLIASLPAESSFAQGDDFTDDFKEKEEDLLDGWGSSIEEFEDEGHLGQATEDCDSDALAC
ncbi:hypothetical protein DAPPUDRAFT_116474 [Daphnia pulex]|uniref:CxC3 like cysteine cluster domain-containing protein n=1 Tax=Daphnia pulex TaxID=6669 RepID=E9HPI2_DAPPU|nr:hypothetical protein DAPPUDRAFT_116474 [Daphnia pulex]|eukprot:EFX66357.1 hypothetical protein DAPPUDRAFT_116474 [Daphnia pulex]